ncbi:MAG TPA: YfhO family protein [Thermoanaerobaculia bacterium]|nr:YfhO family protein [Thermoanaerobaculia bacterium]
MRLGLAALFLLYCVSAALLAWWVRPSGRRASFLTALFLTLLPLTYTASGFLKERTLAPTRMFVGVAPWADPELMARAAEGASAINPVLLDPVSQMIPWSRAARDDLLLNPAQGAGAALLGNGQSAVLFPTEVASRLLAPFRAVTYSQAARLLLAAWGMFILIRLAGSSELAACAAAAVYLGSGFVQLWRLHPHSLVAAAAPWILAAALSLWRRPNPRSAALLGLAGALGVAGGHPETLLHVMLFTALTVPLLAQLDRTGSRASWTPRLAWGVASAMLAFLLAAPILLPFVENLRVSIEWVDRRPLGRTNVEAPLRVALERLRPAGALHALGDPNRNTWRGPENLAELGGGATGGAALFLAILGVATPPRRARRWTLLAIAAAGLLGLLAGAHMPVVSAPFGMVPLLRDTLLKRLALWWVLATAVLVAAGTDAIRDATARSRRAAIAASLAAVAASVAVGLAIGGSPPTEMARMTMAEGVPIVLALIAALLIAIDASIDARRPARFAAGVALLLCALVVPRLWLFAGWIPTTGPAGFYPGTAALNVVVRRLNEMPRTGARVTGVEAGLAPHSAAFYGLEEIRSYDPMTLAPYHRFLNAVIEPGAGWSRVLDPRAPALSFLGVRFVFEHPPQPLPADPGVAGAVQAGRHLQHQALFRAGLLIAYKGPDAVVWERAALARAFFPRAWRLESPDRALSVTAKIDDFASIAVVDRGPVSATAASAATATAELSIDRPNPRAEVLALEVRPGSIDVDVETSGDALLATSQPAIPGWRVEIDDRGARDRLRTVNTAFLGVAVPPGRHRVALRFAPSSWRLGLVLAAFGAITCALLLWGGRLRRPTE